MPASCFGVGKIMSARSSSKARRNPLRDGARRRGLARRRRGAQAAKKLKVVPPPADWKQQISDKQGARGRGDSRRLRGRRCPGGRPVKIYNYEGELKSGFAVGELEQFFRDLREKTVTARLAGAGAAGDLVKPFE
jgi:hypothetical protein